MNIHRVFWNRRISLTVRIALVFAAMLTSLALGWMVIGGPRGAAHAAAPAIRETPLPPADPWGVGFDNAGNIWIAEPGCDPQPTCGSQSGSIAEYNRQTFTLVQNYTEPGGFSSPLFVAIDANSNVWFTEPGTDAIGELIPNNGSPSWQQYSVPTSNAIPYDLTFDWLGNLWFTEFGASNIGEFNPSTKQFHETRTPTADSNPYGIVGPDPTTGSIWFTENNSKVARIGRFTPPLSGALSTSAISEYLVQDRLSNTTPHLLAYDYDGDIWWTEGFDGRIGRLVISQAENDTDVGVTEFTVPPPNCVPGSGCNTHISGIGVDSANTVWFDDSLSARIGSFNPSNNSFAMYVLPGGTGSSKHPHDGLAVDGNNNIWFTEEFADQLGEAQQSGVPPPTPGVTATPGSPSTAMPVNDNWYFGEGRVGNGFNEYITLDNPDSSQACALNVKYSYTPVGGNAQTKTIATTINPATRATRYVNNDLGFPVTLKGAADVSTFVTVNTSITPNCPGIVAERPMYFHFNGVVDSGDDVMGATHTATTFYFADVPSGGGSFSFFTILNPGSANATVTATYYANGTQVQQQTLQVLAGTRGTISPDNLNLPPHVAAIVTSSQPVVIERPSYYNNINGGAAGTVSGGAVVVGTQALSNDWLFAEGTTRSGFQEQFVLANLDTSADSTANVTIKLEYPNGTTQNANVSIPPQSQLIWNVNQNASQGGSVSADISSTGAQIIAEREMFFHYTGSGIANATGVSDVTGEPGPAAQAAYSFAEGYVSTGFNEWLTVQNPTANPERILLTMVNQASQVYTQWLTVGPQTRYTMNITSVAHQYLPKNSEISMLLQAQSNAPFVAERPMYWNQGGSLPTQGGSDVIGYYGS